MNRIHLPLPENPLLAANFEQLASKIQAKETEEYIKLASSI